MAKRTLPERELVLIEITGADSKDKDCWYKDMVGNPMKAFIFRDRTRNAICLSMLDHGLEMDIKAEHYKIKEGRDIRTKIV